MTVDFSRVMQCRTFEFGNRTLVTETARPLLAVPRHDLVVAVFEEIMERVGFTNVSEAYIYALVAWFLKGEPRPDPLEFGLGPSKIEWSETVQDGQGEAIAG